MTNAPIFLCGFMGVGKSTVGQVLAEKLSLPFIDTDQMVIKAAGKSIPKIFAEDGESRFRELESEAITKLSHSGPAIVALGGGALNSQANLQAIKSNGRLIYLQAGLETLVSRLHSTADSRPLLAGLDSGEKAKRIASMLKTREAVYKTADIQIPTDGREPSKIADEILQQLRGSLS